MEYITLFPLQEYWWAYAAFTGLILLLLALDLGVFHRKAHAVSFREAAIWSGVWVTLAMCFNVGLYLFARWKFPQDARLLALPGFDPDAAAWQVSLEFLTGYVVEKSLAIDNIFVFAVIFGFFGIPAKYQHRVLFYGILGALCFRAAFIALGAVLMQYHAIIIVFGVFLIFTGIKMMLAPEKQMNPEANIIIRLFQRFVPVTGRLHDEHFFVRLQGVWHATPLLLALLFLELSDIIFAVDSVPAIFALTNEPLLVFTSNMFAILGLRSMYFMLAGVMDRFHLLKYGLAAVLIFVGSKMTWLNEVYGGKFPITWSLLIIAALIGGAVLLSVLKTREGHSSAPLT